MSAFSPGQTVKLLNTHNGDGGWSSAYIESKAGDFYAVRVQGHSLYHVTADKLESLEPVPADSELPQEFLDKRQSLAMFLLAMATGWTWDDAEGIDHYHENYTADADEIIRANPHLLQLPAREAMGLDS